MTRCIRFSFFSGEARVSSGNICPLPIITFPRASPEINTRETTGSESKVAWSCIYLSHKVNFNWLPVIYWYLNFLSLKQKNTAIEEKVIVHAAGHVTADPLKLMKARLTVTKKMIKNTVNQLTICWRWARDSHFFLYCGYFWLRLYADPVLLGIIVIITRACLGY